jgi:hypothetical protein
VRTLLALAAALAAAGCAARAANTAPEPRVLLLQSVPDGADVELTCHGEVLRAKTPVRLEVPEENDSCRLELTKDGYRPARARLDRQWVVSRGQPLRMDEHHELDPERVTWPGDVLLFPLQRLGDRLQNAAQRKLIPDYRITIELLR